MSSAASLILSWLVGVAAAAVQAQGQTQPGLEDAIVVRVSSLRSDRGSVRCSLYDDAEGFPQGQKHVIARTRVVPQDSKATCTFEGPRRGQTYAVVIHHDENDDGEFQLGILGNPLEGYGFSNNAEPFLSAPSFEACDFVFAGGKTTLHITALD